jgi:hypothetical protein
LASIFTTTEVPVEQLPKATPDADLGSIRADECYPLPDFKRRLGLNDDAMRKAKRAGLPVRRIGRRKFILGEEALAYLRTCPTV